MPALIVVGDQDEPCLEPALFNQAVAECLAGVESGRSAAWKRETGARG